MGQQISYLTVIVVHEMHGRNNYYILLCVYSYVYIIIIIRLLIPCTVIIILLNTCMYSKYFLPGKTV